MTQLRLFNIIFGLFFLISPVYAQQNLLSYPPEKIMGFRGLDTKSTPPTVADSRATDILNVKLSKALDLRKNNAFVTGLGLGIINIIHSMTAFPKWGHLHLEYFHYLLELGIIGLVGIINLIRDFFSRKVVTDEQIIFRLMVAGFLINCLFNWTSHLWLTTVWVMFAYASFLAIENEQKEKLWEALGRK